MKEWITHEHPDLQQEIEQLDQLIPHFMSLRADAIEDIEEAIIDLRGVIYLSDGTDEVRYPRVPLDYLTAQ